VRAERDRPTDDACARTQRTNDTHTTSTDMSHERTRTYPERRESVGGAERRIQQLVHSGCVHSTFSNR
jgi:hypothetical protein